MDKPEPKYRRPLNTEQIQILELLYKFRFTTVATLKKYFFKSNPGMNVFRRLETLEHQGFVAKRYFDNYRLLHKPVAYYLLPAGARKLRELRGLDLEVKTIYKDKSVSEQFIDHCLDILNIYISLRKRNASLKFFTKPQLSREDYNYFPKPLPDAYMRLESGRHFFLIVYPEYQPFFASTRIIKRYEDYFESGDWDDTGTDFPPVLLVADNVNIQRRLHKFIDKNIEYLEIYTALKNDLINNANCAWLTVDESGNTYSLHEFGREDKKLVNS